MWMMEYKVGGASTGNVGSPCSEGGWSIALLWTH